METQSSLLTVVDTDGGKVGFDGEIYEFIVGMHPGWTVTGGNAAMRGCGRSVLQYTTLLAMRSVASAVSDQRSAPNFQVV